MVIVIVAGLITLLMGYSMKDLEVNADVMSYLPDDDPAAALFNRIGDTYGGNEMLVVGLAGRHVFETEMLELIRQFTDSIRTVPGIGHVTSLTHVLDIKSSEFGIEMGRLIDEFDIPQRREELDSLRTYALSKDMYRRNLVSEDAMATLVIGKILPGYNRAEVVEQIQEKLAGIPFDGKLYYGGMPHTLLELSRIIVQDVRHIAPLTLLLISLVLLMGFRSTRGVVLPILTVGIAVVWTMGSIAILGYQITMLTNIIPVVLLAVGSAYAIHVVNAVMAEQTVDPRGALQRAISYVVVPVALASVTTIFGFLSFIAGSYLTMIREFGLFSALGIFFALLMTITFVPAILALLEPKQRLSPVPGQAKSPAGLADHNAPAGQGQNNRMSGTDGGQSPGEDAQAQGLFGIMPENEFALSRNPLGDTRPKGLFGSIPQKGAAQRWIPGGEPLPKGIFEILSQRLTNLVFRRPKTLLVTWGVIILISLLGMTRIERRVDIVDYFHSESMVQKAEDLLKEQFHGSTPLYLQIRGDVQSPEVLMMMEKAQDFMAGFDYIPYSQSVADLIKQMNDVMGEGEVIPKDATKIIQLWFLLDGQEIMEQLVGPGLDEGIVQGYVTSGELEVLREIEDRFNTFVDEHQADGLELAVTGTPIMLKRLDDSIINSQTYSLIIAMALVMLMTGILLRSFRLGSLAVVPIGVTLIVLFGTMGLSGVPLDIATVLAGSVTIGIGIDYAIHFISRFGEGLDSGQSPDESIARSIRISGKAILINVLAVSAGFATLTLSNLMPLQRFGFLIAITMVTAGMATLSLLPLLLKKQGPQKRKNQLPNALARWLKPTANERHRLSGCAEANGK